MKFEVKNRLTGAVQFVAEIECEEGATYSLKLGLAVRWGFKNNACLGGADLRGADLGGAYLGGAYLRGAYLGGAYLGGADLRGAYLGGADLRGADLRGADLRGADLGGADLRGAYLGGAYLRGGKLADNNPLAMLGQPDGWDAFTYFTEKGEQRALVGCHDFTLAEGRAYWAGKENRREVMAALGYAEAISRIRGWTKNRA
ncbi:MAG: pentapeptide repeat-containing protein [Pseudomonadota bacterium]